VSRGGSRAGSCPQSKRATPQGSPISPLLADFALQAQVHSTWCSFARFHFEIVMRLQREASAPGLPANMREAQEVEGLRLAEVPLLPVLGGKSPKLVKN
jgi:hypothetical protein